MKYLSLLVAFVLLAGCMIQPTTHIQYYYIPSAEVYIVSKNVDSRYDIYVSNHALSEVRQDYLATHMTLFKSDDVELFFPVDEIGKDICLFYADSKNRKSFYLSPKQCYSILSRPCDSLLNHQKFVSVSIPIQDNPQPNGGLTVELSEEEYYRLVEEQKEWTPGGSPFLPKHLLNMQTSQEESVKPLVLLDNGFQYGKTIVKCDINKGGLCSLTFYFHPRLPDFLFVDEDQLDGYGLGDGSEFVINGNQKTIIKTDCLVLVTLLGKDSDSWTAIRVTKYAGHYSSKSVK